MAFSALVFFTCLLGLTGLIAGSIGAHGLENHSQEDRDSFKLAAHYQMMHGMAAIAALALSESLRGNSPRAAKRMHVAAWLLAIGTTLFSFTIYAVVLGAPKAIGPLTPLGGLVMMGGWCVGLLSAFAL